MKNPLTNVIVLSSIALLIILSVIVFNWKTANVIVEYNEQNSIGNKLAGDLKITLEPQDQLSSDTPIIISLTKDNKDIETISLTLAEFIALSDNPQNPVNGLYTGPSTHSLSINKVIDYTFTESGDYELLFNIFKLDLTVKKNIHVQ